MREPSLYSCPDLFCCQGWGVSWLSVNELLRIPIRIKLILKSRNSPESVEMLHQCPKDACSSAWRVTTAHLWLKRLLGSWSVWFETELVLLRWGTHKTPCGKMVCEALGGEGGESEKTCRRSLALPTCVILDESCKHLEPQFPLCQMGWMWAYLLWSPTVRL